MPALAKNEQMRRKANSWRGLPTDSCTIDGVNLMQGCNRACDVLSPPAHRSPHFSHSVSLQPFDHSNVIAAGARFRFTRSDVLSSNGLSTWREVVGRAILSVDLTVLPDRPFHSSDRRDPSLSS